MGFDTGVAKVPLVPGAILYDLAIGKATARPTREMGEVAASAASDKAVVEGAVGAGTGATVGKILGMRQAMKSGIGSWTVDLDGANKGIKVAALAAVNALGDIYENGKIIAGARLAPNSMNFADSAKLMKSRGPAGFVRSNNASLNKVQATKLAQLAQLGVARAIDPVNTMSDGDVVIALSLGAGSAPIDALGVAAAEATAEAIRRAVRFAPTMAGIPGLKK